MGQFFNCNKFMIAILFKGMEETDTDVMSITPLGGGQEVGRSCILLKFRGAYLFVLKYDPIVYI